MTGKLQFTAATDKEIFDLLMSARQKVTDGVLRGLALDRGILFSNRTSRERMALDLSLLPHDYASISHMVDVREGARRQEKMMCLSLPVKLTRDEMKQVVEDYRKEAAKDEEAVIQPRRAHDIYVNLSYNEVDYSKTRLIQSQRKDAGIEFITEGETTIIRYPGTEKAKQVARLFTSAIEKIRTTKIDTVSIDLIGLGPESRTSFFTRLMRSMEGYQPVTVINMKVASDRDDASDNDLDIDIEDDKKASDDIVGVVNSVVISGVNLEQSEEYQSLKRKGYFFTAVVWQAVQTREPRDVLQFDVSFEDGAEGTGFRYSARIARREKKSGIVTDKFEQLDINRQPSIWRLIETTALTVIGAVKDEQANTAAATESKK